MSRKYAVLARVNVYALQNIPNNLNILNCNNAL